MTETSRQSEGSAEPNGVDPQDFAAVVRRYTGPVLASALRQLGDRQLAEDATQAVFLAFHQSRQRVESPEHLAGFLFQSTRYVCQNIRRTRGRQERRDMSYARMQGDAGSEISPEVAAALDDAVAKLAKEDRDLVLRRYFEGSSSVELAASLNIPEATVRKRLSRAVERLREHLAEAGVSVGGGVVASSIAVALPGIGIGGEAVAQTLITTAGVATTASGMMGSGMTAGSTVSGTVVGGGLTKGAAMAGSKVFVTTVCGIAVAGVVAVGVVVMSGGLGGGAAPAGGQGSVNVASTVGTPVAAAVAPGGNISPAASAKVSARDLAERGEYLEAMKANVEELGALQANQYRDKKDFSWLIEVAERSKTPLDTVKSAAVKLLADETRNRSRTDWRTHRLLAGLAERAGDSVARRKELDLAIETYPFERYADAARHSSLQHLYNEVGEMIADEKGFEAGTSYVLENYGKDPRFMHVFTPPWEQRAANGNGTAEALASFKREIDSIGQTKKANADAMWRRELDRRIKSEGKASSPGTGATRPAR